MFGTHRIHFPRIDSTNTHAKEYVQHRPPEGTLISADFQTAGRGRLDRQWQAMDGLNLLCTFIIYPRRPMEDWGGLPLLAGCAVAECIREETGLNAVVKWPNDVLLKDRKTCGILLESGKRGDTPWAIIGIGINVNQTVFEGDFRIAPTSLARELCAPVDREQLLAALCQRLDALYTLWTEAGNPPVLDRWKQCSSMFGRSITIHDSHGVRAATALDLANDASLIVRYDDGVEERVLAGDITLSYAADAP